MLSDYKGGSNNEELLTALVGEEIIGVLKEDARLHLIMSSGVALTLTSLGGKTTPAFWVTNQEDTKKLVADQERELQRLTKNLKQARKLTKAIEVD
jgi:hypothetical protein